MRNLPGDPGLEPTPLRGPEGPYVGVEPPPGGVARFARDARLDALLGELHAGFGPQRWWPARTPFEVVAGAVLVQNTAWRNVERALAGLDRAIGTTPADVLRAPREEVLAAIRPSGTYRVKYARLCAVSRWYLEVGGLAALRERPLEELRRELLAVHGVGPETADAILCYAAGRRTFVVDAYARRVTSRHGLVDAGGSYAALRAWFQERLEPDLLVYQEAHALFVRGATGPCRPAPDCAGCPATAPAELPGEGREAAVRAAAPRPGPRDGAERSLDDPRGPGASWDEV